MRITRYLPIVVLFLLSLVGYASYADDDWSTPETNTFAARVVRIEADGHYCSGALIHESGVILTAAHCVADTELLDGSDYGSLFSELTVAVADRADHPVIDTYRARPIRVDLIRDLALVRITSRIDGTPLPAAFPAFELARDLALPRSEIMTLGYPNASPFLAIEEGKISAIERNARGEASLLRTTAHTSAGDSGGPTIDSRHRIVGVHVQMAGVNRNNAIDRSARQIPAEWFDAMTQPEATVSPLVPTISVSDPRISIDYDGSQYHFATNDVFVFRLDDGLTGTIHAACDDGFVPQLEAYGTSSTSGDLAVNDAGPLLVVQFAEPFGRAPKSRRCTVAFMP